MVSVSKRSRVLVWKCLLVRRRNYLMSTFELICPILLMWLAWMSNVVYTKQSETGGLKNPVITHNPDVISVPTIPLRIVYSPSSQFVQNIMEKFKDSLNKRFKTTFNTTKPATQQSRISCEIERKNDENEVDRWLLEKSSEGKHNRTFTHKSLVGIVFLKSDLKDQTFTYKIKTLENIKTNSIKGDFFSNYSTEYNMSTFISVQHMLDYEILENLNVKMKSLKMYFGPLPVKVDFSFFNEVFYLFLYIAYVFLAVSIMREVVEEKRTGLKELMKIMGVPTWMIWIHWYVYTLIIQLPLSLVVTFFIAVLEPIMVYGNIFVIWMLLYLFITTSAVLMFAASCFFTNVTIATSAAIMSYISFHITVWSLVMQVAQLGTLLQVVMCLAPTTNLVWALNTLESFREHDVKWNIKYLFSKGYTGSQISVGMSMVISVVEIVVLIPVLNLLDGVFPGPFGIAKRPNLIVLFRNILQKCRRGLQPANEPSRSRVEAFEQPPVDAEIGIQLRALCKEYGFCKKVLAVDNVDLNIYKGEIMALLGHNGAGKTTIMSMITGIVSQTSGVILVDGYDIKYNLSRFRESLGLCTQQNLLFPKFTTLEHLQFFGMLRGMSYNEATQNGKEMLNYMQLSDKINNKCASLSGGMKRRLCLAISIVGNPKVLILDEPTSGLDPESRRNIWDIILGIRGERTILMTTHFMEEADVLGDRIAIMHQGRMVCCGTTMFLKKFYGVGYNIHIQKKLTSQAYVITDLVQRHIPSPNMREISKGQLDFIINTDYSERFPSLFSTLEKEANYVGITGISITSTTMEDVFLQVTNESNNNDQDSAFQTQLFKETPIESEELGDLKRIKGVKLLVQRITVLMFKRLVYRFRNYIFLIVTILYSCLWVFFVTRHSKLISKIILEEQATQNPLTLKLSLYPESINPLLYDEFNENVAEAAMGLIRSQKGEVEILKDTINISEYCKGKIKTEAYEYMTKTLLGITLLKNEYTIQFQSKMNKHMYPIAVNLMSNILLRNITGHDKAAITVINHPFSIPDNVKVCKNKQLLSNQIFVVKVFWLFLFFNIITHLLADNIPFVAEEQVTGFKLQQIMAGTSPVVYWGANIIFDYSMYILILICLVTFLTIAGEFAVWSPSMIGLLVLDFFLLGLSGIPFTYIFANLLAGSTLNNVLFWCQSAVFGLIAVIVITEYKFDTFYNFILCIVLFSLNPLFASLMTVAGIVSAIAWEKMCLNCGFKNCNSTLLKMPSDKDRRGILIYLIMLVFTWIMYSIILLLLDYGYFRKLYILFKSQNPKVSPPITVDTDVEREAMLVRECKETETLTPLRVESLLKTFSSGPAVVNNVSFLVMKGECFGLLGVNGAGKTTTFKMLTGQTLPDSGDALVYGYSVIRNRKNYLKSVGYCPQFDAVLERLTAEESLRIIGQLRGIPRKDVKEEVKRWLELFDISKYSKMQIMKYSGGTKRKLSTAMAFIGDPDVVFLDEPTTGMDPVSRRKLWGVVRSQQMAGKAVVLTSHSMDECEALCTRLTIMVGGVMKCIGAVEYLKTKFGQGYTVLIKLIDHSDSALGQLKADFYESFPSAIIKDQHKTMIHYQVLDQSVPLSLIFSEMFRLKKEHLIVEDFIVRNATLEEFFISFAKNY